MRSSPMYLRISFCPSKQPFLEPVPKVSLWVSGSAHLGSTAFNLLIAFDKGDLALQAVLHLQEALV